MTDQPLDHEHVSLHIRNHPELFPKVHLVAPLRYTGRDWVDLNEEADYRLSRKL